MQLATLEHHDPTCSGCPACDEAMAAVLRSDVAACVHHDLKLAALGAAGKGEMRVGIKPAAEPDPFEPPDVYGLRGNGRYQRQLETIEKTKVAAAELRAAGEPPADVDLATYQPPDPWHLGGAA